MLAHSLDSPAVAHPPASIPEVSILMPAFNLAGRIGPAIERVAAATAPIGPVEIVVCDDGSQDGTYREATKTADRLSQKVSIVRHEQNRGKGAALMTAFAASTADTVVFLDADLDLPPEQIPELLGEFRQSGADVLVGLKQTAMAPGRYPGYRRVLSKIFSGLIGLLFHPPVAETQTGLKLLRRSALESTAPALRVERYAFDLELIVGLHRRGYVITQAPVNLSQGASNTGVSLRTMFEMARDTLRIWVRARFGRI